MKDTLKDQVQGPYSEGHPQGSRQDTRGYPAVHRRGCRPSGSIVPGGWHPARPHPVRPIPDQSGIVVLIFSGLQNIISKISLKTGDTFSRYKVCAHTYLH